MQKGICCMSKEKGKRNAVLVSVIIPAFNVDQYIETCIRSVLEQDMKDLEAIVVDDGSTDQTGRILDRIAETDDRVVVIHKKNGGVSAARNTGLEHAHGKYVTFIDGDDYVERDYISYLVRLIQNAMGEFAFSRKCYIYKGERQTECCTEEAVSPSEALSILLSPDMIVGCWNKIYDRAYLDAMGIRFSEKLYYGEGLNFITNVAQKASRVGVGNRKVYFYRRDNGQSATAVFQINKIYNGEQAIQTIEDALSIRDEKVMTMLLLHRCTFYAGAITKLIINKEKKKYQTDYKRWLKYIRKNWGHLGKSSNVSLYRKGLLLCVSISPRLLALLDTIRRKKIVKQSVTGRL